MAQATREQVRRFIISNFLFDSGEVQDHASLMGEGIIDSTGVLELVMFVEETFNMTVSDDEVVPQNFDSVSALVAFIERKGDETGVAAAS